MVQQRESSGTYSASTRKTTHINYSAIPLRFVPLPSIDNVADVEAASFTSRSHRAGERPADRRVFGKPFPKASLAGPRGERRLGGFAAVLWVLDEVVPEEQVLIVACAV